MTLDCEGEGKGEREREREQRKRERERRDGEGGSWSCSGLCKDCGWDHVTDVPPACVYVGGWLTQLAMAKFGLNK